ncbi:MAG: FtsX-like permease family protein, partial [Phycisphaerales bacterium]
MTLWGLVKRSLGFFWRTNLGVLLAVVVSTAVLTGALVVGDSVRHSLMLMVNARLGRTQFALVGGDRFFRAALADDLAAELNTKVSPVLRLRGLMADGDGERRVNRVEVLGVDRRFFDIGPGGNPFGEGGTEGLVLNKPLARALDARPGDEVLLRIEKPGSMSRDIPLAPDSDLSIAFRLRVKAVASQSDFGRFGLQANQVAPLNVFVPLEWLQEGIERNGVANTLLVGSRPESEVTLEQANAAVKRLWRLADAGLELRDLRKQNAIELRSSRVFIDEVISSAALDSSGRAVGILVYFVNELRLGDRATPYSTVAAMAPSTNADGVVPVGMKDDEILVNGWLADDLEAKVGDSIELTYYVVGPTRKLQEAKSSFRVRAVLPMAPAAVDPNLMPDYPGLSDVDNCRDWKPGITIDLDKIRKADEDYWDRYRGTPKAFVTLDAGRAMWANMYGNLTAVRYPQPGKTGEAIAKSLLGTVDPASVGLFFQPVRERAVKAGGGSTDFGQLFLGLSMFIVMASLILTGLLFVFGIESRVEQVGLLTAVGFSPKLVRRLLLMEAGILAVLGAVLGALAGLLYTWSMIYGLATVWGGALGGSTIYFHARASTLFMGALSAVAVSLIAIRLTLRRQFSRPARELLVGGSQWQFLARGRGSRPRVALLLSIFAAIGAGLLIATVGRADSQKASAVFFGAGALLLIAGLAMCRTVLRMAAGGSTRPVTSLAHLGLRNATRRSGRSLAVIGLLACGVFLVIAVGANRHDPLEHADRRDSGTGGFALYGESAMGILHDLNSRDGRQASGLDDEDLLDVGIVHLR